MKRTTSILAILLLAIPMAQVQGQDDAPVKYNQYGVAVQSDPLTVEAQDGILVMESKKSDYKMWFDIRVQADGAVFFGADEDYDPIGNGASIRRARFAIKTQLNKDWYGEIDTDFTDGVFELKDAIIRYDGIKNLQLQVGNFKENFSMQRNTTSRYLQFIERPMVTELAPSRHLGFNAKYAIPWLYASAGVFFQEIKDLELLTYVQDNNKDYGRCTGHSFTGKVAFRPLYKMDDAGLHIGAAVSYRTPKSSVDPSDWGGTRISTRNSTSINRKKYLDTDVIPNVHYDLVYTFELAGHYKGLRAEAAYLGNDTHIRDDAPATQNKETKHFWGWYAQAGYLLFGGQQRYDAGGGKYTRVERGRDWGDIELCARYEYFTLNSKDIYGGSAEAYTVGLNYYINNNVKVMLNYQYNNNDRYANGKGKLFVGHDAAGNPTKDPTKVVEAKGKAGVDYNMLAIRFEIDF